VISFTPRPLLHQGRNTRHALSGRLGGSLNLSGLFFKYKKKILFLVWNRITQFLDRTTCSLVAIPAESSRTLYKLDLYLNRSNLSREVGKRKERCYYSLFFHRRTQGSDITSHYRLSVYHPAAGRELRRYHILQLSHAWRILGST
jgi:hypothetical protein